MIISNILPYIQIILSIVLIIIILVQQSDAGAGGVFGGDGGEGLYHTRRGFEKFLFYTTIVISTLFAISSFIAILIK